MPGISRSEYRRLQNLLRHPGESMEVELKGWLDLDDPRHKAQFARAAMALANHGGGVILLGFDDKAVPTQPAAGRPSDLSGYHQDKLSSAIARYADPRFQCTLVCVEHPESNELFPVVIVPGGHTVQIRAIRDDLNGGIKYGAVYIRAPGPETKAAETPEELDALYKRITWNAQNLYGFPAPPTPEEARQSRLERWDKESRGRFCFLVRGILSPNQEPHRFAFGDWSVSYQLEGDVPERSPQQWTALLAQVEPAGPYRPVWIVVPDGDSSPYLFNEVMEARLSWDQEEAGWAPEFWRVSPEGSLYLTGAYYEDKDNRVGDPEPSQEFFWNLHMVRVALVFRHARRLAAALGMETGRVVAKFRWGAVQNRKLTTGSPHEANPLFDMQTKYCRNLDVELFTEADLVEIEEHLPELVHEVMEPMFRACFAEIAVDQIRTRLRQVSLVD
jgi:hypothetical protein